MNRRAYLGLVAGTAIGGLAGCTEEDNSEREQSDVDDSGGSSDGGDGDSGGSGGEDAGGDVDSGSGNRAIELLSHEWYDEDQFNRGVRGRIENVSDSTLDYVEVQVYFIDNEGVQFSESIDNVTDLSEGRVWEFDAMFLGDDPSRIDSYEIQTDYSDY